MEKYIGIIGAIGSIGGAIFTYWQCRLTIKAKNETKNIRDQIKKKYLDYELSHLRPKIGLIVNQLTKHTQIKSGFSQKGLKLQDDIQRLKELLNEIRSNKIYTLPEVKGNLDRITDHLKQSVDSDTNIKLDEIIILLTNISREFDNNIKEEV